MLKKLQDRKGLQLVLGLLFGILFGFFLQKGQVTKFGVIERQLLLTDFTVMKVMLAAIVTGMIGIHVLRALGLAQLHRKPGAVGSSVIGGLIFGVGLAIFGYCPGTGMGAVGQGNLDALFGGVIGMLIGGALYAAMFPWLNKNILHKGEFGEITLPEALKARSVWIVIVPVCLAIVGLLLVLEAFNL